MNMFYIDTLQMILEIEGFADLSACFFLLVVTGP